MNGIVVLRPDVYPDTSEDDREYHRAMEGVADLLTGLPAERVRAMVGGAWLDVTMLSAPDQDRLRAALLGR